MKEKLTAAKLGLRDQALTNAAYRAAEESLARFSLNPDSNEVAAYARGWRAGWKAREARETPE